MLRPLRSLAILLTVSLALTAALVAVGTVLRTPHRHATPSAGDLPVGTPPAGPLAQSLATVDTTTLTVQRAPFCDRLAAADLAKALGGAVEHTTSYEPGGRASIGGTTDTAEEYGCTWRSTHASARAWVFAPPVTSAWAHQLAGTTPSGCRPLPDLTYGAPSTALRCGDTIRLAGLFGDAWLGCTLESRDVDLAGRFCLAVARAAG